MQQTTELVSRISAGLGDRFVVERELGTGGMGSVFLATDLRHKRKVALKVLSPTRSVGNNSERFLREIRTVAQLHHPNILPLHDSGTVDGLLYFIMPHVAGETVAERIARDGSIPVRESAVIARALADALDYAHRSGIVHRDVKPANILLFEGTKPLLADFGIALVKSPELEHRLTSTGLAVGSLLYMSPEQLQNSDEVDGRADVYGLGCTLFEMLAGTPPFERPNRTGYGDSPAPSFSSMGARAPRALRLLVGRMLEPRASRRPFAAEVCQALDDIIPELERLQSPSAKITIAPPRVLVLPFDDLTSEPDDKIGLALADEIITRLANVDGLRVIASKSAHELKESERSAPELGQEVDADYIVEGSVKRRGPFYRIAARLVRTEDRRRLWGDISNHSIDLFDGDEEIARKVVDALRLHLSPTEERLLTKRSIPDVRAFEYFLRAKQHILTFNPEALELAMKYLQAGERLLGGENSHILAAIGYVHWQYRNAGIDPDTDHLGLARRCGERLIQIDPDLPDGHRLLGLVTTQLTGDSRKAISHLRAALERNPYDTDAMLWLGVLYAFVGRSSSGFPLYERLREIDPLTSLHDVLPGVLVLLEGDIPRAADLLRQAYLRSPENPIGTLFYAQALLMLADGGAADEVFARLENPHMGPFFSQLSTMYRAAIAGSREATEAAITPYLANASLSDFQYSWSIAQCLAYVGSVDQSINWLANATRQGFINYPFLYDRDPLLSSLREVPGFVTLMEGVRHQWMNLEDTPN